MYIKHNPLQFKISTPLKKRNILIIHHYSTLLLLLLLLIIAGTLADHVTQNRLSNPPRLIHSMDASGPHLIGPHDPSPSDDEEGVGEEEGAGEGGRQGGNIQSTLTRDERRHLRELMRHTPSRYLEY